MAREWAPDDIFDVFADTRVRAILIATNAQKQSVKDLYNKLSASQSSIYRRVDVLVDYDLLDEQTRVDDDGHHYSVYAPNFEKVDINLADDELVVTVHGDSGSAHEFRVQPDDV